MLFNVNISFACVHEGHHEWTFKKISNVIYALLFLYSWLFRKSATYPNGNSYGTLEAWH